ncbi:MAG TPA: UxaA family hydrolase [Syntrophorhabdaceae bacterium]|nr:UxaA family hydrolase [Syntrophorhabdaceae bacterium]
MSVKRGLLLHSVDNVANVLEETMPGDVIQVNSGNQTISVEARERIPFGFKVAVKEIRTNTPVVKYGRQIGIAGMDIQTGALVHVHNMKGARGRGDLHNTL